MKRQEKGITPEQALKIHAAIHERCVEEGDCLLWTGACSRGAGRRKAQPAFWLDGEVRPMRRLAYMAYGKELLSGWRISTTCGNDECLAEDHLRRKSHSESLLGHKKSPVTVARIAAAKQAAGILDWEKVRAIRDSGLTHKQLAEQYGVHQSTIEKVRAHEIWRERGGFFTGLVAANDAGKARA